MAQSDSQKEYVNRKAKTGHDLSHKIGFTSSVGQLLPIFSDVALPGDEYYLSADIRLARTMPLASAAMCDIELIVEHFFVPAFLIYQPFGSVVYGINDNFSSAFPVSSQFKGLPKLDLNDLYTKLRARTNAILDKNGQITESPRQAAFRLADCLGLAPKVLAMDATDIATAQAKAVSPVVFPWQLCTYHAIYQHFYRLDDKEEQDTSWCNLDRFYNVGTIPVTGGTALDDVMWMRLHYRPYKFDYFTGANKSPLINQLNLFDQNITHGNNLTKMEYWLSDGISEVQPLGQHGNSLNTLNQNIPVNVADMNPSTSNVTATTLAVRYNTAALRSMFAQEKLLSITSRSKKKYDDQTLAHFGVDVPHDVKHEITFIGRDKVRVDINAVVSQAETTIPLGELAGMGTASMNGQGHKFVAPCHGFVMSIYSAVPRYRYIGGLRRENAITDRIDFFQPEYDALGQQPLFGYECDDSYDTNGNYIPAGQICGWEYRYQQFKSRYDRASCAFMRDEFGQMNGNTLESWMLAKRPFSFDFGAGWIYNNTGLMTLYQNDALDPWTIFPTDLNQLMLVNYSMNYSDLGFEDKPWLCYSRDPFVLDAEIKCKKVSIMSKYSMPDYE